MCYFWMDNKLDYTYWFMIGIIFINICNHVWICNRNHCKTSVQLPQVSTSCWAVWYSWRCAPRRQATILSPCTLVQSSIYFMSSILISDKHVFMCMYVYVCACVWECVCISLCTCMHAKDDVIIEVLLKYKYYIHHNSIIMYVNIDDSNDLGFYVLCFVNMIKSWSWYAHIYYPFVIHISSYL